MILKEKKTTHKKININRKVLNNNKKTLSITNIQQFFSKKNKTSKIQKAVKEIIKKLQLKENLYSTIDYLGL
jgi:hypothetical protein